MSTPPTPLPIPVELTVIVASIGDTQDNALQRYAPLIWGRYDYLAATWPQLQRWYTQRDLLWIAWAPVRDAVSFSLGGDASVQLGQKADHIMAMLKETNDEIARLEVYAAASMAPVVGTLAHNEIMYPPYPMMPNGNSPTWSGSIYPDPYLYGPWPVMPP